MGRSTSAPLQVSPEALERVRSLIAEPRAPGPVARAAAARFKKSARKPAAE